MVLKMMKYILFSFLLTNYMLAQIQIPLEKNNYKKLTSYDELSTFLEQLDQSSDLFILEVIGKSVEGRNVYVLKFSNSEFGKDESKIKVLIFAQQHGNEQSGKEGALMLINGLLKAENQYLFDKMDFCLVPQMNPDGSEANKRRNGNNMDLNRNHLILTEPETIALHKLFNDYHFEVTMDVHEYWPFGEDWKKYGYRRNFDETVGSATNINVSEKLRKLSDDNCIPFLSKYLNDNDFSFFDYVLGGPPEVNLMRYSTYDINDGRQSFAIQNSFSFIMEGMNGEDYNIDRIDHRANGQMTGMLGLLKYSYDYKDEIKNLVKDERAKLIFGDYSDEVDIQLDHFADGNMLELPLLSYYSNEDTIVSIHDFRPTVKSLYNVVRPKGYLIPKNLTEIIDWADRQELKYYDYKKSDHDRIEQYYIAGIDSLDFEREIVVNPIVEVKEIENNFSCNNYIFIPVNQLRNKMIVIALEPKSMLGLITYEKYQHLLKSGTNFPILRVVKQTF